MQEWWENLNQRERQIVAIAGALTLVAIFYWAIWSPIADARDEAQNRYKAQLRTLAHVQQVGDRIASLRASGAGTQSSSGSLQSIVSRSAQNYKLNVTRYNPSNNKLQLSMEDAPFENIVNWLVLLVNQHGVQIENIEVTETDVPGVVRVRRLSLAK
ncbi:type II secretion system protein GspM [Paraferrimonas sedimenticola]|uniref:Type II secretion system protein M n=1 Tax=Paraferrimonas sedimenticola TaxID=375674 RepID=A0AA37RV21_9GAMM|nr:type II secretion system protein M [Paraferrimonas sedimenticola]GLP95916.1 type II secretion system protein M [Paraferrimonas sedimenticola]